ncbi:hypothetical protein Kpol_1010p13 [Vanderwaltozyma polyspora DSM 70294]|uniref:RGS domain-containing protein n=1 Tax=Vanderwaltozyma polyspora (strain ATCC 22028 / DSM 70294 / BCRC 21397 / CBS 2163 / NBRC 10782 / NRRL Y-8283 / UCD 57-17) TaxID=436907 RepID=A7TIG0_VANPO|nr:uncharacterized protein Kpol_1010p13 [Vanderwaltozyma polyspora DSM 70294]EDO17898.1 hypothetical protein Kpol_1010p13 [Vanderwaltozyma polyspora DSM 70294]
MAQVTDFDRIQQERLPTLYEVLIQKTDSPVDLWSFYTFLSQFPHALNYLEFWIDLMSHIRLCKDYIRGIRESVLIPNEELKSRRQSEVYENVERNVIETENDIEQPNKENNGDQDNISVTSSILIDALMDEGYLDFQNPQKVNRFLQGDLEYSPQLSQLLDDWKRHSGYIDHSNDDSYASSGKDNKIVSAVDGLLQNYTKMHQERPQVTAKLLLQNAQTICSLYLISPEKSEKYLINVPEHIRNETLQLVEIGGRHDPEVFESMRSLAYQFLEIDCFSKFLNRVALHNIHDQISDWKYHPVKPHSHNDNNTEKKQPKKNLKIFGMNLSNASDDESVNEVEYSRHQSRSPFSNYTTISRICFGTFWMGIGFWIGYVLIFLNYNRGIRVVTIVPFAIGSYFIVCGIYQVDVVYSWFGVTQELMFRHKSSDEENGHPMNLDKNNKGVPGILKVLGGKSRLIRIDHQFIRNLLFKRGLWCCAIITISTAIFTVIFSCVPGRRV